MKGPFEWNGLCLCSLHRRLRGVPETQVSHVTTAGTRARSVRSNFITLTLFCLSGLQLSPRRVSISSRAVQGQISVSSWTWFS